MNKEFFNYLSNNEGNIYISLFIIFFSLFLVGYFNIKYHLNNIKKEWPKHRCNPIYMPFASMVNQDPNITSLDYTSSNFSYCSNTILKSMVNDFTEPIYYMYNVINNNISSLINNIQSVRKRIFTIIDNIENIDKSIMGKIFSTTIPLQHNLIKTKDTLKKTQAVGTTGVMTMIASYFGIISFIRNFVNIAIEGLLILTGIIVPLLIFIFTIPVAIPLLVIFGIISGFLAVIIIGLQGVVHKSLSDIPKKPHCFDENTLLELDNGKIKKIKELSIGEKLKNDGIINGIFKINSNIENMYNYYNIIVSGSHNIYENGIWINVKDSNYSIPIKNYKNEYIYCLNTDSGIITINNHIFSDWNDIDGLEYFKIKNRLLNQNDNKKINENINNNLIKKYEYGLFEDTPIELENGIIKKIKEVDVNDILKNGEKVNGIVQINGEKIDIYHYSNLNIYGTNNICIFEKEYLANRKMKTNYKIEKLYNLITNTGTFKIKNIMFNDYNNGLEKLLSN